MKVKNRTNLYVGAAYFAVLAAATAVYIVLQGTALKIVASALFLAGAAVFAIMSRVRAQKGYPAFGWLALAAAALCFAGDAAIEFHFLAGMVLFGAGHIVYIAGSRSRCAGCFYIPLTTSVRFFPP